jgi:hypothetical protein
MHSKVEVRRRRKKLSSQEEEKEKVISEMEEMIREIGTAKGIIIGADLN